MSQTPREMRESLQREIERLFRDLIYHRHPGSHFNEPQWSPLTDVVVMKHAARVLIELAGVPRESVKVRLRGNVLEVSGRRDPVPEPVGAHYHRAEIYFGPFRRVVELPWAADEHRVEAFFKDGMLEINLRPVATRRVVVAVMNEPGLNPVSSDEGDR